MKKNDLIKTVEGILTVDDNDLRLSLLNAVLKDKYNITVSYVPNEPPIIDVIKIRNSDKNPKDDGIIITYDGGSKRFTKRFTSKKALIFSVKKIGCKKFHENQGRAVIVSRTRPNNIHNCKIKEIKDLDGTSWFVNTNCSIENRVKFLNKLYDRLGMKAWKANRCQLKKTNP